jgi:hypothetical protein
MLYSSFPFDIESFSLSCYAPKAHLHMFSLFQHFIIPAQIFKIPCSCSILPVSTILIHAPVFQLP